jgi:hypothetical protein
MIFDRSSIYAKDGGWERDQLVHTRTNALMSTNTHLRAHINEAPDITICS